MLGIVLDVMEEVGFMLSWGLYFNKETDGQIDSDKDRYCIRCRRREKKIK